MPKAGGYAWRFKGRFRKHAFGWKSQPAITRLLEALSEIKQVARLEPLLAAEGAITLLERISPALERVDSSSGAIGSAVNRTSAELVPVIAAAPADAKTRALAGQVDTRLFPRHVGVLERPLHLGTLRRVDRTCAHRCLVVLQAMGSEGFGGARARA